MIHVSVHGEDKIFCGSKDSKCGSIGYALKSVSDQYVIVLLTGGINSGEVFISKKRCFPDWKD